MNNYEKGNFNVTYILKNIGVDSKLSGNYHRYTPGGVFVSIGRSRLTGAIKIMVSETTLASMSVFEDIVVRVRNLLEIVDDFRLSSDQEHEWSPQIDDQITIFVNELIKKGRVRLSDHFNNAAPEYKLCDDGVVVLKKHTNIYGASHLSKDKLH